MISTIHSNNRYLVAKYAPDLRRMEPRNIGVILWADGAVASRFLTEKDADFVEDASNYRRWREFWTGELSANEIKPIRGAAVARSKPEFLDALKTTQQGNYLLLEGGVVFEELKGADVDDAADFLFDQFVATRHPREDVQDHDSLNVSAERLIEESGLPEIAGFKWRLSITCPVFGIDQPITLDYGIQDDGARSVFQRVSLKSGQSARNAAVLFHSLASAKIVGKQKCCALVDSTEPNANPRLLSMMRKVGQIADVAKHDDAIAKLRKIAGHG